MSQTRKTHSNAFKAKVAIEAMSGLKTLEETASKYKIHPVMVSKWKGELQKNAESIFSRDKQHKKTLEEKEEKIRQLYQTVGQREYELDWLKKNMEEC